MHEQTPRPTGSSRAPVAGRPPEIPDDAALSRWLQSLRRLLFASVLDPSVGAPALEDEGMAAVGKELALLLAATAELDPRDAPPRDPTGESAAILRELPEIARLVHLDVRAAVDGDPAAGSLAEVVACYPGPRTLVAHRVAHVLHARGHQLLARMLAESAHRETGIDIHPGATIGESCFIDHGTGVVIGETAVVGDRCRIYQGVTLGARSIERGPQGVLGRGTKRHPTLEDDVVVYAGATILGGDVIVGRGCVVAGGIFVTRSVPAGHVVAGPRVQVRLIATGGAP